jgi:peptidoglycan/xylan/chitin deacetylase (PgdA/CDA1 family)
VGGVIALCGLTILLAAVAFFLAPTGHANLYTIVQVNGVTLSVSANTEVSEMAEVSALLARAGSRLDVDGDVAGLGTGAPAVRQVNGRPMDDMGLLRDGAVILVRHGRAVVEGITKTTEEIPFETVIEGQGNIVSFIHSGSPGRRDVFRGAESGEQAACLVMTPVIHTVYRLNETPEEGQKLVALTFDDGPGTHTQEVLDALAAAHVPGTFFVLGSSAAAHPELIEQMRAAGHEVENHTWSHPWLTQVSAETFASQISRTNAVIGGSQFLRPPYGDTNATVRARAAAMGLRLAFWTVDTRDWEVQEVDAIMSHVRAETAPGAIILMHDGGVDRLQTVAAIPVVVDWLFEQGYSLTTLDQIL